MDLILTFSNHTKADKNSHIWISPGWIILMSLKRRNLYTPAVFFSPHSIYLEEKKETEEEFKRT